MIRPAGTGLPRSADVLIVGGGTAGCVLANRLSADPERQVVMIEAGAADDDPRIHAALQWPSLQNTPVDWAYLTAPQERLEGRRLPYPRGKVLGGSSSINAMGHHRGHRSVFDAWSAGNPGWGFDGLLPYFKKSEDFSGGADDYRGTGGPIAVSRPEGGDRSPVAASFIEAAGEAGHPFVADFNGAEMAGRAWNQLAIRDGIRQSTARGYLHPAASRPNLTVLTEATALGLDIEGGRCLGVRIATASGVERIGAGETILAAGAVDTPRLMLLSGIGPADELRAAGVTPRVDLPGVGRNLQDHVLMGVVYRPRRPLPASKFNHADGLVYWSSRGEAAPNLLVQCVTHKKFSTRETGPVPEEAYSLVAALMSPASRGRIGLASSDPLAPAVIDTRSFSEPSDFEAFRTAVETARELGAAKAMDEWRAEELLPGKAADSRAGLEAAIRRGTSAFFHPVGTCRMGSDPEAVVGADLSVKGVAGLRVIDASVMPLIPNALINAAVLALAEKGADLVLEGGR